MIELLVVLAVIAILASLLLPALAKARSKSRQVACLSNQREIGIGFQLFLLENDDRFPDRRDLKQALGFMPWTTWPPSDPRGGWAAAALSNQLPTDRIWVCPALSTSPLRSVPQVLQLAQLQDTNSAVSYWLWRFDRLEEPVPLDNFWGKPVDQCIADLVQANNPTVGQPTGATAVELLVDPYFPNTISSLSPDLRGQAIHARGRNRLFLDMHAEFARDPRLH